jgi:hypothetical protein
VVIYVNKSGYDLRTTAYFPVAVHYLLVGRSTLEHSKHIFSIASQIKSESSIVESSLGFVAPFRLTNQWSLDSITKSPLEYLSLENQIYSIRSSPITMSTHHTTTLPNPSLHPQPAPQATAARSTATNSAPPAAPS